MNDNLFNGSGLGYDNRSSIDSEEGWAVHGWVVFFLKNSAGSVVLIKHKYLKVIDNLNYGICKSCAKAKGE